VEYAFGICASERRILDKAIETKVYTGVEIVKCIALLHHIVIDVEGLHHSSSNDIGSLDTNDGTRFKNPEYITLSSSSSSTTICRCSGHETKFLEFSTSTFRGLGHGTTFLRFRYTNL
jgi:hypothetical protein